MYQYYFLASNGIQTGPVAANRLKDLGVTYDTPVWREGMPGWLPAATVPELQELFLEDTPKAIRRRKTKSVGKWLDKAVDNLFFLLIPIIIFSGLLFYFIMANIHYDEYGKISISEPDFLRQSKIDGYDYKGIVILYKANSDGTVSPANTAYLFYNPDGDTQIRFKYGDEFENIYKTDSDYTIFEADSTKHIFNYYFSDFDYVKESSNLYYIAIN